MKFVSKKTIKGTLNQNRVSVDSDFADQLKSRVLLSHPGNDNQVRGDNFVAVSVFKRLQTQFMNKKALFSTAALTGILAVGVFSFLGGGESAIAHAASVYEQNMKNAILHQVTTFKPGKDSEAYYDVTLADFPAEARSSLQDAMSQVETSESWMHQNDALIQFGDDYTLMQEQPDGSIKAYTSEESQHLFMDGQGEMPFEEIEIDALAEGEVIVTSDTIAFDSEFASDNSPHAFLDTLSDMAESGDAEQVDAYELNGDEIVVFEQMFELSFSGDENVEMFGLSGEINYLQMHINTRTGQLVKQVNISEIEGVRYETMEMVVESEEWLDESEYEAIFSPDAYGLVAA